MSEAGLRGPGKFIRFFRLVDACDRPGCPVCRCLLADARQYLASLLYEQVNDPDTRRRLHASWGFCNWHAWMLREVSDSAFGSAIMYEDLLLAAIQRFERKANQLVKNPRGLLGWLSRLGGRARRSLLAEVHRRRTVCPGCQLIAGSEVDYVRVALQFIEDPQFDRAYGRSEGLCVPHALQALQLGAGATDAQLLVTRTLPKWAEVKRDLQGFVDKHDYRNRRPFTEAESTAYLRALEALTGARGLFANDLRAGARVVRGAHRSHISPARPPERGAEDADFERGKLEPRIKEQTEQLNEASGRAAALHDRLAQLAADRNALELNVSRERAANELGQRLIAELRAEVERLQTELQAARSAGGR